VRILLRHRSLYRYPRPAALGAHLIRLRPAPHTRAGIETYGLSVTAPGRIRWQQDPAANYVASVTWEDARLPELSVDVELAVDIRPVNPFDFTLDPQADRMPFSYGALLPDLAAYLDTTGAPFAVGRLAAEFLESLPREGKTVDLIVELNRRVARHVRYVIREEAGIWTPEETLRAGRGSCRDSSVLLIAALRSRGLAARFASGYLVQLTDEGMLPDQPKGVSRDVADLHAWAEVFLPGAGWVGLDPTSGLLCGEGHIPLACTATPALAAPVEGSTDVGASEVQFEMRIGRLGHEVRPTAPFTDEAWEALRAAGVATDEKLRAAGIELTAGGEPTFNSRLHTERPEWNSEALGPTKWEQGLTFARGLRSILRHDPDKIMVGEIRDNETAQIAINSALTGHLVFTTVHANNVLDVLGRFLNMGVEAYQFVSALNCVLAQRLVRNICHHCKRPVKVSRAMLEESGLDLSLETTHTFYEGVGCIECGGTGYKGRTAICELLDLSDRIREMILEKRPTSEIKKAAREEGMRFLRESAVERVMAGVTTLREINKVTFVE